VWKTCGLLFLVALIPCTASSSSADIQQPPAQHSTEGEELARRFPPKFQAHIVTNVEAVSSDTTNEAEPKGLHWDISWKGWDGLETDLSRRTPLATPREMLGLPPANTNLPRLHLEQVQFSANITALLEVDGALYQTSGNLALANDIALRRARINIQGDCIILFPFSYKFELGYVPNKFNLHEAWLSSQHIDYIGYLKVGIYGPPMGLDLITSSRDLAFMEPATALQALAPANEAGIQIGQPVLNQRATWTLGIFGGGPITSEYGNASQDYGNLIGRLTWLAYDHMDAKNPVENSLLHLGASANFQYSASSLVQYRSRPESYLAEHVIDTGQIDARASGVVGAEVAYVDGPLSVQGEFLDSVVRENNDQRLDFCGFYASASWFLTGESRLYDRFKGCFNRVVPRHNFNFGRGGAWGAFELSTRFSYTDLTDADVNGGKLSLLMGELNWYLHSHVRWMFNGGGGHVTGGPHDGDIFLFQTRIGIDF
jgi:phosphate-selective porin OprO/OprP